MVERVFNAERKFLVIASMAKQPSMTDLTSLLKPISDIIEEIQKFRETNRRSQYFNHLSAISESIPALGWVCVTPAPSPYVKEMNDAGQFYTNRVLKDWKEKDKTHIDWVKSWITTLTKLQSFVKSYHTTGVVWNPSGVDYKTVSEKKSSSAPMCPPPPPLPSGLFDDIKVEQDPEKAARNALFADLNRGDSVTKGLKKVTADMQTHKNPALREYEPKITKPIPAPKPAGFKGSSLTVSKTPKLELSGKKWEIEFFKNNPNLVVESTSSNQSVYIYRCDGSTIKVTGKCNNIIMDGCKKSALVFDNVVSSVEFINCQSVQMQVLGRVPTINIDKTDGCQVYLSKDSLDTEFITAKSSEMNVLIPSEDEFVEQPIPEQFKTTIKGTKLVTKISESV